MKSEVADVMKLDKEYKLFIGGKWVSASDGKTFTTVCSATGEKLAESEEDLLEHRTDGTDAFDTLYIGCERRPYSGVSLVDTGGIL